MKITRLIPTIAVLHLLLMNGSCQTTGGLPADALFPEVPPDLVACAKRKGVVIPARKLAQDEAEMLWRSDRNTIVVLRECFTELIVRNQRLSKR